MSDGHTRNILLNTFISRSVSRAPKEHDHPDIHSAEDLLQILQSRQKAGIAVEYFGGEEADSETQRKEVNKLRSFMRLADAQKQTVEGRQYFVLLIEYVNHSVRTFPVVDTLSFEGRDLAAEPNERGSASCHVVVQLPREGSYDDGTYRCVIEHKHGVTRRNIEALLCAQLRRHAKDANFNFVVEWQDKKGKLKDKSYKYHPKIDLASDVGRSITSSGKRIRKLSHVIFTNRAERQDIASSTSVDHEEVFADVEVKISGKQAPTDPEEARGWFQRLKEYYENRGYKTRLYFRHIGGATIGGRVHDEVDGAADVVFCAREIIETTSEPRRWMRSIEADVRDKMIELLERDEIWKRAQQA